MKPLVSIIMPSFNSGRYIHNTIKSVVSQSYNNWELIIGTYTIPNWISIIGIVVPAILAFHLIKIKREL